MCLHGGQDVADAVGVHAGWRTRRPNAQRGDDGVDTVAGRSETVGVQHVALHDGEARVLECDIVRAACQRDDAVSVAERLVEAAAGVMREKGLARTTTKEIARAAGYAEGTLYNHFASKEDLFLAVLGERLPGFVALVMMLPERAGRGTVCGNLTEVATTALAFYMQSVPMAAAIFAEPDLLARHIAGVRAAQGGPHQPNEAVAAYLRAEQRRGRLRADADPQAAADLLLGACFQQAFLRQFLGTDAPTRAEESFARDIVHTLLSGLSPDPEEERGNSTLPE